MLSLDKENSLFSCGHQIICGLDEAGRGPLAGPVVAAAVSLDPKTCSLLAACEEIKYIKDSKKLTAKKRDELFDFIQANFCEVGIGICDHETIDRINILEATFLAMKKAISALREKPAFVMLDGKFQIPNSSLRQEAVVKGDNSVLSIAAASIVAKVARDRMMDEFHEKYPMYGFDKHRGYGTKIHMEAVAEHGPCPIHRKSFAPISKFFQ
ncbi:ribonuclease HII [Candidatus Falkowbacteria bacterium]|nr:ribonuclease HII [Candidatus Falkowbacteria bacterium]